MTFQIWDVDSANLVSSCPTEDEALAIVRSAAETYGLEIAAGFILLREDARGRLKKVAEGAALVDLARARSSPAA